MLFAFYPKHQYGCPHVDHCPHLGGAGLGSLVFAAEENQEWTDALLRQVDDLREQNAAQARQLEELCGQMEQLKAELKAERQKQAKRPPHAAAGYVRSSPSRPISTGSF